MSVSLNVILTMIEFRFHIGYSIYTLFYRKMGLLVNNVLMLLGGLLMLGSKYAESFEMLIAGRFFIGVNAGINAGISPMYLTEISPVALRGAVSTE